MGAKVSVPTNSPSKKEISRLASCTKFNEREIELLWKRYDLISNSKIRDGTINIAEFQEALGLNSAEFSQRIFSAFDHDSDSTISFDEFVRGLSSLSPRASIMEKAQFCFLVYDIDKNGYIEKEELKEVLKASIIENQHVVIPEPQLEKIIDATFKKMDLSQDGKISIEEFMIEAEKNPSILACVNLQLGAMFE